MKRHTNLTQIANSLFANTLAVIGLSFVLNACSEGTKPKYSDTYSSGKIKLAVDHSYLPIVESSIQPYYATYPKAQLDRIATTEDSAIRLLALDSVQLVVATRELKPNELEAMAKSKVKPVYTKIAVDGVALIINKQNADSLLQTGQVADILTGKIKTWGQLGKGNKLGDIVSVFDNDRSANLTYMQQRLGITDQDLGKAKIYAAGNNQQVIEYVKTHPEAIGFVGVGWVFDTAKVNSWLPGVQVVGVGESPRAADDILAASDYYQPYQAYLGDKSYPFRRDVYWIYRSGRTGLAMGYAAYMASDKGQRIILKLGMLPANVPVRMIKLRNDDEL